MNKSLIIFGIVNITSDSFSDGGRYLAPDAAIAQARKLMAEGADVIDLGPASSTGAIRAISVSDETGAASGLLDAGPRSITSAPSAISLRACAMAASGARYRPPSEKLSEVMLTMPKMMSDLFMGASIIIIIEHEYHTDARVERESPGE